MPKRHKNRVDAPGLPGIYAKSAESVGSSKVLGTSSRYSTGDPSSMCPNHEDTHEMTISQYTEFRTKQWKRKTKMP